MLLLLAACEQPASGEGSTTEPAIAAGSVGDTAPAGGSATPEASVAESPPPGAPAPDCKELCKLSGACVADSGRCIPTSEDHCKSSQHCKEIGFCALIGNACQVAAQANEDCNREHGTKKHNPCVDWGRCTAQNGTCLVTSDADCQQFRECKRYGYCRAKDGKCVK